MSQERIDKRRYRIAETGKVPRIDLDAVAIGGEASTSPLGSVHRAFQPVANLHWLDAGAEESGGWALEDALEKALQRR
jgi:hypothetical protein